MAQESPAALRSLASELISRGASLFAAEIERRARWLSRAFAELASADTALGRAARPALALSSGLSEPMVEWALEAALAPLTERALSALAESPAPPHARAQRVRPGQLCVVVLAGNVATGPARAVGWPLLFGWPVLAKAASEDDTLARLLQTALVASDPELGAAYRVVNFGSGREALSAALFEQADLVSAYGSDGTLNAIRAQLGATATFVGHGHGLGAAFIARPALAHADSALCAARALAFDVAAYDQRGCLSPHVAWVERGGSISPARFAELLFAELQALQASLPRGLLPPGAASAQLSWRGIGAIRGDLLEGDGFAVAHETSGPLRISPGYRNLQVIEIEGARELPSKLAPLGVHLKCLGVAGVDDPGALFALLPARVAPRICVLGRMQRPPVCALQDGLPPWEGLLRWADGDFER